MPAPEPQRLYLVIHPDMVADYERVHGHAPFEGDDRVKIVAPTWVPRSGDRDDR